MGPAVNKTDSNQAAIAEAFRARGAWVFDLHAVGRGCPDLLVASRGRWLLVEVKSEKGKLTPQQVRFIGEAGQRGAKVYVVRSVEDAGRVVGQDTMAGTPPPTGPSSG
jgi:hypothetical protein